MNKTIRNIIMLLVVGMMSFTAAQAQNVSYSVKATDTFGDGWNGGEINITIGGVTESYTLAATGAPSNGEAGVIGTFAVPVGEVVGVELCGGSFPTEIGFSICDSDGNVAISGTGSGIAAGTCADLGGFTSMAASDACTFQIFKTDTFGDGWNGFNLNVDINGVVQQVTLASGGSANCTLMANVNDVVSFEMASGGSFLGEIGFQVVNADGVQFSIGPGGIALDQTLFEFIACEEPCGIICPTSGSGTWVEQYFLQAGECSVQATIPVELTGVCEVVETTEVEVENSPGCNATPQVGAATGCTNSFINGTNNTIFLQSSDPIAFGGGGLNECTFFGSVFQYEMPEDGELCFDYNVLSNGDFEFFAYSVGVDWSATVASIPNLEGLGTPITDSSTGGSGQVCVDLMAGDLIAWYVYSDYFDNGSSFGPQAMEVVISGLPTFLTTETVTTISSLPAGLVNYQTELGIGEDQIVEISYDLTDGTTISCEVEIDVFPYSGTVATALACNDDINVSVDENCMVTIGADMFLEGGPYSCFDDYIVRIRPNGGADYLELDPWTHETDANGAYLALPNGQHIYEVIDPVTGNTCWGYFTVEDKFPPTLDCACPVGGVEIAVPFQSALVAGTPEVNFTAVENCMPLDNPGDNVDPVTTGEIATFTITPECGGPVSVAVNSDWGDAQVYIYNQPLGTNICDGLVAWDGDSGPGFDPVAMFEATAGTTYTIVVGAWAGSTGNFELLVTSPKCLILVDGQDTEFVTPPECRFLCFDEFDWSVIDELPGVTVTDNCGAGDLASTDVWLDGAACGERVLYRTWSLTDPNTGESTTCTQEFFFEAIGVGDLSLPPATVVLACGGDSAPEDIAAEQGLTTAYPHYFVGDKTFDDDGNFIGYTDRAVAVNNNVCNLFASYTDVEISDCPGCPGNRKIIRTWDILDWCEGDAGPTSYIQVIKASDSEEPYVSAQDITVSVNPWGCAADFYLPCPEHLGDDCYGDNLTYTVTGPIGVSISAAPSSVCSVGQYVAAGAPIGTHTFTYIATDCCGNVGTSDITVTVVDNTPPVAIAKEYIVISLTSTPGQQNGFAKMYPQSVDNGSHDGDCGDVSLEIRRADGAPDCGNIGNNGHNNNITFNNDNPFPGDDRDDTDGGAFVKFCCLDLNDVDANGTAFGNVEVELRVFDALGNYSDTWAYVRVEDKLAAQISCPADVVLKCDDDYTDTNVTGMASGSATCDGVGVTYTDDANISTCGAGVVYRTWCIEGTNNCCTQKITIDYISTWNPCDRNTGIDWPTDYTGEDELGDQSWYDVDCPNINAPSPRDAIDCADADTGEPEWTDSSCDLIGYSLDSDTFYFEGNACFKVLNNWSVINWCIYNPSDADWNAIPNEGLDEDNDGIRNLLDLNDNDNYQVDVHGDLVLDANGDPIEQEDSYYFSNTYWLGTPFQGHDVRFYFDNDGGLYYLNVTLSFGGDVVAGRVYDIDVWDLILVDSDNGYFGVFDANAEDDGVADGLYEHTQVIKLIDTEAPEILAEEVCFPVNNDCVAQPSLQAMACDTLSDCGSDWIKWQAEVDIFGDWTVDYVYSSFIADIPANRPFYIDPTGSCETVSIDLPAPIEASKARHRILWRATDGCGNVTSYTTYFTIEDKKAPTPYCINLSTALMENGEVELWACDFDAGAFDFCTPTDWLRFTFNGPEDGFLNPEDTPNYDEELNCQAKTFDCGHFEIAQANGGLYPVRIYVWDECGNVDFCMVNLRLVDNTPACTDTGASRMISGEIFTEEGEMVEDAMVESNEMTGTFYNMDMTNVDGVYGIAAQPSMDYELNAVKNDDYLNGVTTLDIVLIQRHILDLKKLDSPYKLIAADASNDERISAVDLIQLRKLILGIYDELPANDSWRFVDAKETLNDANPWPFTETINVMDLTNDMMEEDFVGVKIGDVNGSVDTHYFADNNNVDARSANDLILNAIPTSNGAGEVSIEITSSNFNEVSGLQFTLEAEGLELTNVQAGALDVTAENFAVVNGKVTSSWNSNVAVSTDDVLFTLTFTGTNENALEINSSITKAEAYIGSELETVGIQLGAGTTDSEFVLMQNEPNPFNNTTVVGFTLPTESTATLTVYDVTGKVMTTVNGTYSKGYNEIELSKKDMSTSGVLYYQLDSGDFTATKKMIILD